MKIAFLLTPKSELLYESDKATMRQLIERMEHHGYSAIPIIDDEGKYVSTVTEGDVLRKLKSSLKLTVNDTNKVMVSDIPKKTKHNSVNINADVDSIIKLAKTQNFVPVTDDEGVFIGIIKRSDIIDYCYNNMIKKP